MSSQILFDQIFFIVLPYVSIIILLAVSIQRYRSQAFSYSSLSSQFLENQQHFWGVVPFHYGIITVLFGHLIGFLIPEQILWWNSVPLRLYFFELTGFIFAILCFFGLVGIIARRLTTPKIKMVTSFADWVVFGIFIIQILSGLYIAVFHSWGSSWFATSMAPYLWSIFTFSPDITYLTGMPFLVKLHIASAYVMISFFPYTRLVHILVVPNPYLWRKPQVVRWYTDWRTKRVL